MLPAGTITFLFSDIEGSTRLLTALGTDRYAAALEDHRRLLREAFARHGGSVVGLEGDSFFVAFAAAQEAAAAAADAVRALDAHDWPADGRVRVRFGLHTCEATPTGGNYVGLGVHRAARICAAGHGGQVLLSQTTRDLVEEDARFRCVDLGRFRLKDFESAQPLFQLAHAGLPSDFPPLRTPAHRPTNLAAPPTPLVGRERELAAVCALAGRGGARVVTLTGPGGTGKTRLATEAAISLLDDFDDGAFLVELAAIRDGVLVVPEIARTLGLSESAGQALAAYLAPKRMLVVLDNLEQIDDAATPIAGLAAGAPRVTWLATTREPLRITAEQVYPVPPLALPDLRATGGGGVSDNPAVRLFVQRAQASDPSFALTSDNETAVAEICVRLDGLPLALELAAARVPLLSPGAMVKRMGERLRLLTGGARDQPARMQTLRNMLAWSHDLLSAEERTLFAALGVFAGGFTLEAAESVGATDIGTLASLVDKSLVRRDGERYAMLETIREYAAAKLAESGTADAIAERHAAFCLEFAERAHARRWHHEQEGLDQLSPEHDNLRAALDWLEGHDPGRALRLAGALGWFWHLRSHFAEGRARLAAALEASRDAGPARARAVLAAGGLAAWAGDLAAARPLIDEAIAWYDARGDRREVGWALLELGWGHFYASHDEAAKLLMERSVATMEADGDRLLRNRARIGLMQVLVALGELDTVEPMARAALAEAESHDDPRSAHFAWHFLADCALIPGDGALAEQRYRRALETAVALGDRAEASGELQGLAMAAALRGNPERALRLGAAASAEFDALAIDVSAIRFWGELLRRILGRAREELGADAAAIAQEAGRRMGFDRAVAEARAATDERP